MEIMEAIQVIEYRKTTEIWKKQFKMLIETLFSNLIVHYYIKATQYYKRLSIFRHNKS